MNIFMQSKKAARFDWSPLSLSLHQSVLLSLHMHIYIYVCCSSWTLGHVKVFRTQKIHSTCRAAEKLHVKILAMYPAQMIPKAGQYFNVKPGQDFSVNFSLAFFVRSEVQKNCRNHYFCKVFQRIQVSCPNEPKETKERQNTKRRLPLPFLRDPRFRTYSYFQKQPVRTHNCKRQKKAEAKRSQENPNKKEQRNKWRRTITTRRERVPTQWEEKEKTKTNETKPKTEQNQDNPNNNEKRKDNM